MIVTRTLKAALLCAGLLGWAIQRAPGLPPEWAQDAIWYQIFPERFRNGDPSNDPTRADLEIRGREWKLTPWTNDWYAVETGETKGRFYQQVTERRYGGDLQGVLDKLDYLKALGINAIYFNPVFDAHSHHKYDASSLHHIDRHFGPDPSGDGKIMEQETDNPGTWKWTAADRLFLRVIERAHELGIRVMIDGVFNHTGTRFWAFKDVQARGRQSRYADWYKITRWGDGTTNFDYEGWFGVKSLPELKQDGNGLVHGPREYIFAITKRWMDPGGQGKTGLGIDGWRLDVANQVNTNFWKEWRGLVKKINPDCLIVGEIWGDATAWLRGDQFDSVMNYRFARAAVNFFINRGAGHSVSEFDRALQLVRESHTPPVNLALQNLFDSHDTERLSSMILNPGREYDQKGSARNNPDYRVEKPRDFSVMKLMLVFQMTYTGAPMIYYGDEAGMWGGDDPDDRKPMLWQDLNYAPEKSHPLAGQTRPADPVVFDAELFRFYQKVIAIRHAHPALRRGSFRTLLKDETREIFCYERVEARDRVIVLLNNSNQMQQIEVSEAGGMADLLGQETRGSLITLKPHEAAIFAARP